jgi:hypothetical protein
MKKITVILLGFIYYQISIAQTNDTIPSVIDAQPENIMEESVDTEENPIEIITSEEVESSEEEPAINISTLQKNTLDTGKIKDMGVAVSPSSMRFRVRPGKREVKHLTITNDTYNPVKFKLTFSDVTMNSEGKIQQVPLGQINNEYGLTRWITASPNFVELAPGEKKKIEIVVNLPDEEDAYKAAWCLLMVDKAIERQYIAPDGANKESVALGVIPTYGFGVYIYQNPPNVSVSKVEIEDFIFNYDDKNKYVQLKVRNVGTGISYCNSYIEINNLKTGKSERISLKSFNVLPSQFREFQFMLPGSIGKGSYSALAVLDFGSQEELEAAEIEFDVK